MKLINEFVMAGTSVPAIFVRSMNFAKNAAKNELDMTGKIIYTCIK